VLPVEWWDQKWIDDNIKPKLEGRSGQEIAEAQQPVKGTRKGGGKRRRQSFATPASNRGAPAAMDATGILDDRFGRQVRIDSANSSKGGDRLLAVCC
jgi:hypothetical protein